MNDKTKAAITRTIKSFISSFISRGEAYERLLATGLSPNSANKAINQLEVYAE